MPGRAKSETKKAQIRGKIMQELYQQAVTLYREEHAPDVALDHTPLSIRGVCDEITERYIEKKKKDPPKPLSSSTLGRLLKGQPSKAESGAKRRWLLPQEEATVIRYAHEVAARGFPLTHQMLKEVVDKIVRARLGSDFPEDGVGKQWTKRFVERNSDQLKTFWSSKLDSKRGQGVNPNTNAKWFSLLGDVLAGRMDHEFDSCEDAAGDDAIDWESIPVPEEDTNTDEEEEHTGRTSMPTDTDTPHHAETQRPSYTPIDPDCIYGADESGFMENDGVKIRVIGSSSKKMQHKQGGGSRENTTVIVTVCADGTALAPTVIFKGTHFKVNWDQDNPTKASLAHSKKGWTDGEIRVEWIKDFHEKTKDKAAGRTRVLLVDGHNSHYTSGFLRFARAHRIHVLCYPAHATHVYQGLDVVIFSPLKHAFTEEKQKLFDKKHQQLKKDNFLGVYGRAHLKALTESNIKAAFAKTGVWPFDPSVVTPEMMAPSKETSSQGSLPVPESTPIRAVSNMILGVDERSRKRMASLSPPVTPSRQRVTQRPRVEPNTPTSGGLRGIRDPFQTPISNGISALEESSVSFLLTKSPIRASSALLPEFPTVQFSPAAVATQNPALDEPPTTFREQELLHAYRTLQRKYESLKDKAISLQSAMVLNTVYCDRLREQLATQDEAKKRTKSNKRLMGDGMPRLLTSEEFVKRVEEFTAATEEKERQQKERKASRVEVAEVRREYEVLVAQRKKENERAHDLWITDLELWTDEKKKGKPTRPKPLFKHFKLPPIPKPAVLQRKVKEGGSSNSQARDVREDGCISDVSGSSGSSSSDTNSD